MAKVRLLHWKADESAPYVAALEKAGHTVDYDERIRTWSVFRYDPPQAVVIHLGRLPSHGREVATTLRNSPRTRQMPIVFVGGEGEKLDAIKALLPDATFTTLAKLGPAVKRAMANVPALPVKPTAMMDRFKDRTAAQKLGVKEGSAIGIMDAPPDYAHVVGALPEGASWVEDAPGDVTLWFVHGLRELHAALPKMRKIAASTKLWALWRKGRRDGVTDGDVREGAIGIGLVDYKVCSVNDVWSGYALAASKASKELAKQAPRAPEKAENKAHNKV